MFHSHSRLLLCCGALFACACASAHGEGRWEDMSSGLDETEVADILGTPLIIHEGRGYRQWTFDAGGLVMFHNGTVSFWGTPAGHKPRPKPGLPTVITEPIPGHETPVTAAATPAPGETPASPTTPKLATPATKPDTTVPATTDADTPKDRARVRSFAEIAKS